MIHFNFKVSLICLIMSGGMQCYGQRAGEQRLEKFPEQLETDFALSALPPHLRSEATVYLLDPGKGYYMGHRGSNGFMCFVARTEWEWGIFSKDVATPVAYDNQGFETIFAVYRDVEAMRASDKFTAVQIRDTVVSRVKKGFYKAPGPGISYMLAPIMRSYTGDPGDNEVTTMSGPHYMFYAPYLENADIGSSPHPEYRGPLIVNQGDVWLGKKKGPHGYIIMPAGSAETAKILADNKELLQRLIAYRSYFSVGANHLHH